MVFGVLCCLYLFGFHSVPQLVNKSFPPLMLGTLDSSCLLILLIYTKHKDSKVKTWTDPTSSFLIHWVEKRVNNSRQVAHKKLDDTPFPLYGFSRNIASTPNYKSSKIRPSISSTLLQKVNNIKFDKIAYILRCGKRTRASAVEIYHANH